MSSASSSTVTTSPPTSTSLNGTESSHTSPVSSLRFDDHTFVSDINDFEEIGLSDDIEPTQRGRQRAPTLTTKQAQRDSLPTALRDLTHNSVQRPRGPPTLQTSQSTNAVDHHLSLHKPSSASSRRNHQSQPPSARRNVSASGARSRNSSPAGVNGGQTLLYTSSVNGLPKTSPRGTRRMSWAERRKTSEQLEKEVDSDDDDIPEDTVFCNVPLSPRSSRVYSNAPSPDLDLSVATPPKEKGLETGEATEEGDAGVAHDEASGAAAAVESPAVAPSIYRGKSWNDAMDHLDPEVKELSEKLEEYAEHHQQSSKPIPGSGAPNTKRKSSTMTPPKSASTSLEQAPIEVPPTLPPLQTSNGIIDPLPISKEKEAVLSRTRPPWLPPKSKEEEKRHLKEYQRMMRRSQDAERKRQERERADFEARERMKIEQYNVWEKTIIPNWTQAIHDRETRELWWKGIAPRCRGDVWKMAFGNQLAVTNETYRLALKRGKEIELGVRKAPSMYSQRERDMFEAINRDVKRTFEEMKIFQEQGPLHTSLIDVLLAYSQYRSDVGYLYGTHVLAGLLLLSLSPSDSFIVLANILNRPLPLAFYTSDESAMSRAYSLFRKAFQYKLPNLYNHFERVLKLDMSLYLEPMFMTCFALHAPPDLANRMWDVYAFEGDGFLVRAAIGVLMVLESRLYGSRDEVVGMLGWGAKQWKLGEEEEFMKIVRAAGKEEVGREMDD